MIRYELRTDEKEARPLIVASDAAEMSLRLEKNRLSASQSVFLSLAHGDEYLASVRTIVAEIALWATTDALLPRPCASASSRIH